MGDRQITLDTQELKLWKYNSEQRVRTARHKRGHVPATMGGMTKLGFIATDATTFYRDILSAQLYEFATDEQKQGNTYSQRVKKIHEIVTKDKYIPNRSDYGHGYGKGVGKVYQPTNKNPYDYCFCEWEGVNMLASRIEKSDQSFFLDDDGHELATAFVIRLPHNTKNTPSPKLEYENVEYDDEVYRVEVCVSRWLIGMVEHDQQRRHPYNAGSVEDLAMSMSGGVCLSRVTYTGTLEDAMREAESKLEVYAEERQAYERNYQAGVQAADILQDAKGILEHVSANPISLDENGEIPTEKPASSVAAKFGLVRPKDPREVLVDLQDQMKIILERVDDYDKALTEAFECGLNDNTHSFEASNSFTLAQIKTLTEADIYG